MIRLLLLFYFFFALIFAVISAIAVHQLLRYKVPGDKSRLAVFIYVSFTVLIIVVSLVSIFKLDWS